MTRQAIREAFIELRDALQHDIIGQAQLVERLLIALLVDGHLLLEGPPGLAKTRAVRSLAGRVDAHFQRIQFTPDLLPADLTGTEVFRPADGSFVFQRGPLFGNLILADEINRAPAKVQSALLEAMAERQISVGGETFRLPDLFLVLATQNPLEQEGTYPLPEAQLDRFLMHVRVDYPAAVDERRILERVRAELRAAAETSDSQALASQGRLASPDRADHTVMADHSVSVSPATIRAARRDVLDVHLAEPVEDYIVRLVIATREAARLQQVSGAAHPAAAALAGRLAFGASPRATLAFDAAARARAWLDGRDYVSPADVQSVAHDVLRHRLVLSFESEADGWRADQVVDRLLDHVAAP